MIYNERQYLSSQKQLEILSAALENFQSSGLGWLDLAQTEAIDSQIREIKSELREYELIKEGKVSYTECSGLSELPKTLITARIASGMNQKDLAEKLNLPTQQIQRYEASNYMAASLSRLICIAEILNVRIKEYWVGAKANDVSTVYSWSDSEDIDWEMFPANEMIKRGWIANSAGVGKTELVRSYFLGNGGQNAPVLHRKKFHGENKPNEYALLAWQARVLEKARQQIESGSINEYEHSDSWLRELARLTNKSKGPLAAKDFLAHKGVILVIERHLPSTYLDGAAMILETGHPVVAMTIRHDRLDNFWFVLFHELAHISLHLFDSLQMDFFDEESKNQGDGIEKEADDFALESLIDSISWDSCLSRFLLTKESILLDAKRLDIHPSIIAGRIRKESGNYSIFSDLLGQGKVRTCFEEEI
ncbi:MAG: XRE family transcriptional regulator [Pseudomonas sp.]